MGELIMWILRALGWCLRIFLMMLSALLMFFMAAMAASHLADEYLIEGLFTVGRYAFAGYMILYVEIWSGWNRLR